MTEFEYDEYGLPVPSIRGTLDEEPAKNKGAIFAAILTTIATAVTGFVLALIGWGGK